MSRESSNPPPTRFRARRSAMKTYCLAAGLFVWAVAFTWTAAGGELGDVPAGGFRSPEGDMRFSAEAGAKPLNNLVFELLNVESPGSRQHKFHNPREGWLYLRVPPISEDANQPVTVVLDDKPVALRKVEGHFEAMRYITEGPHAVGIAPGGGPVMRLEVRAIGELFYAVYGGDPHIPEMGVYTWDFLRRHCLDHYNCIIGAGTLSPDGQSTQEAEIREWTGEGKRWFTLHSLPLVESADEAFNYWTQTPGMRHPLMHGIWGDEFGPGRLAKYYPHWVEALRRIHADPKFRDRKLYAYCPSRFLPVGDYTYDVMFPFIRTVMDCGYRFGPEWYLPEGRSRPGRIINKTEDLLAELSPGWEQASRESYERVSPGAATNRVVVLSMLSEPGWETGDLYPNYDYNVFLDCQFQFLATDPAFFGLRGVQGYHSSYCGEEQIRLFAKLVRHYAIEGNINRMLQDPYVLTHLQNPDFEDGTVGWTLTPAVATAGEQSMTAKTVPGFGVLQARYQAPKGLGDAALWTRRSLKRPNVISQQIQNLTPGRLYSLRLITGDYQELSKGKSDRRKHAVSVRVRNAEPVVKKCFQATSSCGYYYPFGVFNKNNAYWINYHQHVFRATEASTRLELSDWSSDQSAGGPGGEELIWNFIQVQPYLE